MYVRWCRFTRRYGLGRDERTGELLDNAVSVVTTARLLWLVSKLIAANQSFERTYPMFESGHVSIREMYSPILRFNDAYVSSVLLSFLCFVVSL